MRSSRSVNYGLRKLTKHRGAFSKLRFDQQVHAYELATPDECASLKLSPVKMSRIENAIRQEASQ